MTSDIHQIIDAAYDELNREAVDHAVSGDINIFDLDKVTEMHDQQRAMVQHDLKRRQRLAKRALRRGLVLPPTHEKL